MKVWSRPLKDASFHLATLAVVGVAAYAYAASDAAPEPFAAPEHPANCHACSTVPPGAPGRLEAYLVVSGGVEAPGPDR